MIYASPYQQHPPREPDVMDGRPDVIDILDSEEAMTQREDALKFETARIKALQEERLHIQKKTFTKWINSFLSKARMEVEELFTDLSDGKRLLKLLEIISGERLGKPNNGRMRVHKIENVNKSLAFLHTKVRLESIGAEDIVDGNPRLILGLIWTIILRFQIQEIEIEVEEDNESSEKRSAKDALLLWCQRKTSGYPGVNIQDFSSSWRSGLGFNALIHSHRPDLIDFNKLSPGKHIDNLNYAFDVAQNELGVPRLLDAEDIDTHRPDEKSVLTYVASYYHTFARMKTEMKSGKRIANILGQVLDSEKRKARYELLSTNLLDWIRTKIAELNDHAFPNSLEGTQSLMLAFKQYRTLEKPLKYLELNEIEMLHFHINTQLKSLSQPLFVPLDGQLIQDLQRAWENLEKAENRRESALRTELQRQERLEQLAYKFERKRILRDGYLKEMIQVLSDPRYGSNLAQVDATVKKHEAISADIHAREERFNDLTNMAEELVKENYHGCENVVEKEQEVMKRWKDLLSLLDKHKTSLTTMSWLMSTLREIDTLIGTIDELAVSFLSNEVGNHLIAVEDLLQIHALSELQVNSIGEAQRKLHRQSQNFLASGHKEAPVLQKRLKQFDAAYVRLQEQMAHRRSRLEDARTFFQFIQDHEEEEGWIIEKGRICQAEVTAKDLRAVLSLQQKHKALQAEMKARRPKSEQLVSAGKRLVTDNHPMSSEIVSRTQALHELWSNLEQLAALKSAKLEDAAKAYQFYADANEAESWLKERQALVESRDLGQDEPSSQALLQRHKDLEGELSAYQGDVDTLNAQAEALLSAGITKLELLMPSEMEPEKIVEEWTQEVRTVPQEVWVEEEIEKIEPKTVLEQRSVPQVKSLYPFSGQGMSMVKGELMFLLEKTNGDWWHVRRAGGQDGFVPANYVQEVEPKIIQVQVRRPEKVKIKQKVKKIQMVQQTVPVRKQVKQPPRPKRRSSVEDAGVEKRQKKINDTYSKLQEQAKKRRVLLEDAIRLYGFYRECDSFEKWMKDCEKMLNSEEPSDNVDAARRQYEKFLTDMSASGRRLEDIDKAVKEFAAQGHSSLTDIKARQRQIHSLWDHLNKLRAEREKSLEGASSVELFRRTCEEAKDWMVEKMTQLDSDELGPDLKTVQALQRRHGNLERELAPVQDKVERVNLLAASVKNNYPNEKENVNARQKEIQSLWENVKTKALERRTRLEDAVGQQIFINSSKNLLGWLSGTKAKLKAEEPAKDVQTAQNLIKEHKDIQDDIQAHKDEFVEVCKLGRQLMARPNSERALIQDFIARLNEGLAGAQDDWAAKQNRLQQGLALAQFNREADQIDANTKSHEEFLKFPQLGGNIDDVEALLRQHEDFENKLTAQEERLKNFAVAAEKLVDGDHYDKDYIKNRKNEVVARRAKVRQLANERRDALLASRRFQQFSGDADELRGWLQDKLKTAKDENFRELANLERKLQKHEAFERELRSNHNRMRDLNKTGDALTAEGNYRSADVKNVLSELNQKWDELMKISADKGRKLRQAAAQHSYNRTLEDARIHLDQIESSLRSQELGTDLRSCKELLKKHQAVESEISQWQGKLTEVSSLGQEMAHEGHFDADNILKSSKKCADRLEALREPARKRRQELEESLKYHKFKFELDAERQWIQEHMVSANAQPSVGSLYEAQSAHKKHAKLKAEVSGHGPHIEKTLASGAVLAQQPHPEAAKVGELCAELSSLWEKLNEQTAKRGRELDLALKAQQYLFEAQEVENWLSEKADMLNSTDFGRDRDATTKLLTKHKALELQLDSYDGIISEMSRTAGAMVSANHPDSKIIKERQEALSRQLQLLMKQGRARQSKLVESLCVHEYFAESAEFEQYVKDNEQNALSEDYGSDYEHLLLLQARFDDFRHRLQGGAERFKLCEELARKLKSIEGPVSADIESKQTQLSESWNRLLALVETREQKLAAAGEIHRFHRDVAEALARIQEKSAAIPEDKGKDLNSVLALIRRHEGFENDLVALEAQLQVLVEDAARLTTLYPGNNAKHISDQQAIVIESWNDLQSQSLARREELGAACDLQRFLTQARSLMSWSTGLRATLLAEEKVSDAAGAQALKAQHEAIKSEIEAREDNFRAIVETGEALAQGGHSQAQEIQERLQALLEERQKLHTAWQQKKVYLDQLIDLHFFLRDAKQLETLSSAQEVALQSSEADGSVEEVSSAAKKHESFEKLLAAQDEKFVSLNDHCQKLTAQNHFDSENIGSRLKAVLAKRKKVKDLSAEKKHRLQEALLHAQFVRDTNEAEVWIAEKMKALETQANLTQVPDLETKIKRLQKHQAFQSELKQHQTQINSITNNANTLMQRKHKHSRDVRAQLDGLLSKWKALLQEAANQGRGLEEAQDILEFNLQTDKIEAWIRDKELLVSAQDTGRDYEHCSSLQRRLDDVDSDMKMDDERLKNVSQLADKIVTQGSQTTPIKQRKDQLISKWKGLQGALSQFRSRLGDALEVHALARDVADTVARTNEKAALLSLSASTADTASLQATELRKRKHKALLRDVSAIEAKKKEHESEGRRLSNKFPDHAGTVRTHLSTLETAWEGLQSKLSESQTQLEATLTKHQFYSQLRDLEAWAAHMAKEFDTEELPQNTASAEHFLQQHSDRKAEIDGRQEAFRSLREFGQKLGMEEELPHIEEVRLSLSSAWEARRLRLQEALQLQKFKEMAENAESWLASKEAFLAYDDLGDSLASVEALLRKHEAFEKTLSAQVAKVSELEKLARDMSTAGHFDSEAVQQRVQTVCKRREKLCETSALRKKRLLESKDLQMFLRSLYEVDSWLNQKLQVASDENYRDQVNLTSKIQRHQAFEAELAANKDGHASVSREGEALVAQGHFASMEIQSQLAEIDAKWRRLLAESETKRIRLKEAYQALLLERSLGELESWLEDFEVQLQSEDHGSDLSAANSLVRKHAALTQDYWAKNNDLAELKANPQHAALLRDSHLADALSARVEALGLKFTALQDSLQIRKENLDDSQALHQLLRDVDEQIVWLNEKTPLASSEELGTSLDEVKALQRKHQALDAEIAYREQLIRGMIGRGQSHIKGGHFASPQIEKAINILLEGLNQLKDAASLRKLRLQDALEAQMFYSRASEVEQWVKDRLPSATSPDFGKDEDAVDTNLKKLDALLRDIHEYTESVNNLDKLCMALLERNHFDEERIKLRMKQIQGKFEDLRNKAQQRQKLLESAKVAHQFLREASELEEFLNDQMQVAASEEYGNDIEHVELLIQKFDSFLSNLHAEEARVTSLSTAAKKGLSKSANNADRAKVEAKLEDVMTLYQDLKELAAARQEALAGAKQVHIFDRTADETIAWAQEKTSAMYAEGYGHDLESIQALVRKHQGYERDMEALKSQVDTVNSEAARLSTLFPDAKEHIDAKKEELNDAFVELQTEAKLRCEKLQQAEKLQAYFDEYRDLMAWINEMMAKITSPELAADVPGAELLISRHEEYQQEMSSRNEAFADFFDTGNKLIEQGHFLSSEIRERLSVLETRRKLLVETWARRKHIYEQNLDTQIFKRDAEMCEAWLSAREPVLHDPDLGESIPEVEELIRKHEDFEKTVEAQEDKFNALKRITLLEQEFTKQKEEEEEAKKAEKERADRERQESRKRAEIQKITEQRRKEDDRRRAQEMRNGQDHYPPAIQEPSQESGGFGLSKSGSFTQLFNQRRATDIKRAESMKVEKKANPVRRVPSFTTRRRTQSFRRPGAVDSPGPGPENLPPVEIRGILDRKHELMSGGKRATVRSWKSYYTVLCGQLLCFFKDLDDFVQSKAATSPIIIYKAKCEKAEDYTKKKHVFRLSGADGSEYLFLASTQSEMEDWINKVNFHADLPPNLQLLSYEEAGKSPGGRRMSIDSQQSAATTGDASSSEDEVDHHHLHPTSNNSNHASTQRLQPPSEKPPVPPRGPSTQRSSGEWAQRNTLPASYRPDGGYAPEPTPRSSLNSSHDDVWLRRPDEGVFAPPLPSSMPPPPASRQPYQAAYNVYGNLPQGRPTSVPAYPPNLNPSQGPSRNSSSEYPPSENGDSSSKKSEKKQNALTSLFRKKKATHL
ncbi:spectrin beta chain, non-erythrocytic 2 isoform X2 [Neocloeon triangulifer]|uniref:spectrin beta chain, non-erythrocytic 2 isoform X2 n=1 Tax=Neocloeon triangulifer TaxID=2078957 RepID=UPI00286F356B|nr:spectrin beta chain, non-erythrocytic 2 isoform X2 [Neocloeon triangulifer]